MAWTSLFPLALCLAVLIHTSSSLMVPTHSPLRRPLHGSSQEHQYQLQRINALEPSRKIQSEAGFTEIWDEKDEQFRCAGVVAIRHTILQNGLLLPAYANGAKMIYVEQGKGIQGAAFPGCPETYESPESQSQQYTRGARKESPRDRHQKIREIREGDILALPSGTADWYYNNGQNPLVLVLIVDTRDWANQLDENYMKFFLAGNLQEQIQDQREQYEKGSKNEGQQWRGSQQERSGNIFSGFDVETLAEAFNIDLSLANKLKSENDNRGAIVRAEGNLALLTPETSQDQETYDGSQGRNRDNNLVGTETEVNGQINFCSQKLKYNVKDQSRADVYNPRAGRLTNVNSLNLPILGFLQLSAQFGVLYQNAMVAPNWNVNAHSICYITKGSGRVQIVGDNGQRVYDGEVKRGQIITAPQNFVVVKRAGSEGLEWVSFKTADRAQVGHLAGDSSVMRSMPVDVIANAYRVSREDARRIKYSRQEGMVLSPASMSQH